MMPSSYGKPGECVGRAGDEIVVCGTLFHTGTRVITWMDKGGFNAYSPLPSTGTNNGDTVPALRYGNRKVAPQKQLRIPRGYPGSRLLLENGNTKQASTMPKKEVKSDEWDLEYLREVVHQLVIHYDGCGTARRCFKVLHDERALSCHFIIDLDGTIYQTLDCKERAWHATTANDCSVGIEICNLGALSPDALTPCIFEQWYRRKRAHSPPASSSENSPPKDNSKMSSVYLRPPYDGSGDPVPTTPGYVGRPATDHIVRGVIQGQDLHQWDFTQAQYDALCKLSATLSTAFPRIKIQYPKRRDEGIVRAKVPDEELQDFEGLIGHYHVQSNKVDPGPAFQWDYYIDQINSLMLK
mmetsp:Transcript_10498/g.18018  ORF Transcript_10498/g.18018 Transcript_10498/m.18018 type:complete len:354 (-) Transcript_10498:64-1125(-)|eukprot:CAMPEP_0198220160 /NCGR_PEP_ID=MMETSP1445-20131203/77834_1 /TAXON_ID=36898 /ORGANISM="Pyramimonas sp., Strain CCMP2087" /LENGTH=353 /DNA_ID=CAMNT_0043897823 /DNA_START=81 /DNA_END=1142 /DNA_ORIENTATION=+